MVEPGTKLSDEEVRRNADIADGQADSTHDNCPRPSAWKPALVAGDLPLVSTGEYEAENPYK